MEQSNTKEIPIEVKRGEGTVSPHVLDLRIPAGGRDEDVAGKRASEVAKQEERKQAAWGKGKDNWIKYRAGIAHGEKPRSFQWWRKGGYRRQRKYTLKLNLYLAAARSPEERVAEMVQEAKGLWRWWVKAGNAGMAFLFFFGRLSWRAVKWWGMLFRHSRPKLSELGSRPQKLKRYFDFFSFLNFRVRRKDKGEKEEQEGGDWDEAPVSLWRRSEVITLVALTMGLLIAVKGAGSLDDWRKTRGAVLGEAVAGVEALMEAHNAFNRADMPYAIDQFFLAQDHFSTVSRAWEGNALTSALGNIPPYKSGVALVKLGERASRAAEHLLMGLKSLDEGRAVLADSSATVTAAMEESAPRLFALPLPHLMRAIEQLKRAEEEFGEAQIASAAVRVEDLPQEYRPAVSSLKAVLPPAGRLMQQARWGAELLASFFGARQPRRVLVIFQNDAELRPTGGFMGSYALLDTHQGEIRALSVPGGGFYDFKGSLTARVDAPYPFHIFSPSWQVWNANWFFDVPTSARTLAWFIEKSQGPTVDGMILITPTVLENILTLTGPVVLPHYQAVIDERNVRRILQDEAEQNYDREENKPKQIIADLVPLIIQRIPEALTEKPGELLALLARALDRHDILVWSLLPSEQARVEEVGWGGRVSASEGDYLAVVHTNVRGGKTDRVFNESWTRTLALTSGGDGIAKLEIVREHRGNADDSYEKTHHVDYVRVFVPEGSMLISASGFEAPDPELFKYDSTLDIHPELAAVVLLAEDAGSDIRVSREHGRISFGGWIMTKVGETSKVTITYRLPKLITRESVFSSSWGGERTRTYSLSVQRQPGAPEAVFTDTVLAPEEWGVGRGAEGQEMRSRELLIDRDTGYTLTW